MKHSDTCSSHLSHHACKSPKSEHPERNTHQILTESDRKTKACQLCVLSETWSEHLRRIQHELRLSVSYLTYHYEQKQLSRLISLPHGRKLTGRKQLIGWSFYWILSSAAACRSDWKTQRGRDVDKGSLDSWSL